ncbi:MAG: hypothetical protein ACPG3X_05205 [Opitutales bacterium]
MASERAEEEARFATYEAMEPTATGAVAEAPVSREPRLTQAVKLTLEEARHRIGTKTLKALGERFNGSLAEVRATDQNDQLF